MDASIGNVSRPRSGEGFWLWIVKILAGGLILFLLGLHFVANHLVAPEGLMSYKDVLAYYQNPIIPIIEILFLVTVLAHALLGFRGIILDLNPPAQLLKLLDWIFIFAGVASSAYGIWLVMVVVARGTG